MAIRFLVSQLFLALLITICFLGIYCKSSDDTEESVPTDTLTEPSDSVNIDILQDEITMPDSQADTMNDLSSDISPSDTINDAVGLDTYENNDCKAYLTEVKMISAGSDHTCVLLNSGGVKCWGSNTDGQLGIGSSALVQETAKDVVGLSSGVISISSGGHHTCALLSGGGVKCWGRGGYGQIGNGKSGSENNKNSPVDVVGLSSGVKQISCGGFHTCALLESGGVKCWGYNEYGQVGNGSTENKITTPVDVEGLSSGVIAIAAGYYHSCAILENGKVKCWGHNHNGQVGDGTKGDNNINKTPVDVINLSSGIKSISLGFYHTCAVTDSDTIKCWGSNLYGQIGLPNKDNPVVVTPADITGLSSTVSSVEPGGSHTCALLTTGGVECWGSNWDGQLGYQGGDTHKPVPVIGLSSGVTTISSGYDHTCAVLNTGEVKCWGTNKMVQLGINDPNKYKSEIPVPICITK